MYCTECGEQLAESIKFCPSCGAAVSKPDSPRVSGSEKRVDSKDTLHKVFIGPRNQDYYYEVFNRFDTDGRVGVSWNWPAFFFSFYWMLYRKMWYPAAGYFLVGLLFSFLAVVFTNEGSGFTTIDAVYLVGAFIIFPMYANALYYNKWKELIVLARSTYSNPQDVVSYIQRKGGTSKIVIIIAAVFVFIMTLAILAAIAIPAYQDYATRAQVQSAYTSSQTVTETVSLYYQMHNTIPASLEQLPIGRDFIANSFLAMDSSNGQITVSLHVGALNGEALILTPYLDDEGKIFWECNSEGIKKMYLPSACIQQ